MVESRLGRSPHQRAHIRKLEPHLAQCALSLALGESVAVTTYGGGLRLAESRPVFTMYEMQSHIPTGWNVRARRAVLTSSRECATRLSSATAGAIANGCSVSDIELQRSALNLRPYTPPVALTHEEIDGAASDTAPCHTCFRKSRVREVSR